MSGQDDKFAIIDCAKFKYNTLQALLRRYEPLIRLPPLLESTMDDYGSKRILGISGADQLESALQKGLRDIRIGSAELGFGPVEAEIRAIINYSPSRAEAKYREFQRWRKSGAPQLPSRLEGTVEQCEQATTDENLYRFERALESDWAEIESLPERRDELRLIAGIGEQM
ncbi:hypothetical protein HYS47_03820 [Candidatus Woesearchaeota archaeon]|nr:hypothetical protein [Candidatus Woesearchaeota archaeon]